jgi:hypothetical protein
LQAFHDDAGVGADVDPRRVHVVGLDDGGRLRLAHDGSQRGEGDRIEAEIDVGERRGESLLQRDLARDEPGLQRLEPFEKFGRAKSRSRASSRARSSSSSSRTSTGSSRAAFRSSKVAATTRNSVARSRSKPALCRYATKSSATSASASSVMSSCLRAISESSSSNGPENAAWLTSKTGACVVTG